MRYVEYLKPDPDWANEREQTRLNTLQQIYFIQIHTKNITSNGDTVRIHSSCSFVFVIVGLLCLD